MRMVFSPVDGALADGLPALAGGALDAPGAADADGELVPQAATSAALVPPRRAALSSVLRLTWCGERPSESSDPGSDVGIAGPSKAVTDRSSLLAVGEHPPSRDPRRIFHRHCNGNDSLHFGCTHGCRVRGPDLVAAATPWWARA